MSERVIIEGGRRMGRRLQNEAAMRAAKEEGKDVFTQRNGVWFAVDFDEDGNSVYTALTARPAGV